MADAHLGRRVERSELLPQPGGFERVGWVKEFVAPHMRPPLGATGSFDAAFRARA
jgi:hypothetical protein